MLASKPTTRPLYQPRRLVKPTYAVGKAVGKAVGFTLVELLITTTILGMIAMAIMSGFAGGLRVYERVRSRDTGFRPDALLSLEKLETDLRNTVYFSGIDFIGEKEKISFAGLTAEGKLGKILYYVKGVRDTLVREEQDYARAVSKISRKKGKIKELVPVRDIDFSYYYYDREAEEYRWQDFWEEEEEEEEEEEDSEKGTVPLGVRIKLTFEGEKGDTDLTRTVLIPIGRRGPLAGSAES